ncbi:MAG: hypothetical protein Q4D65_10755, partial [Peptostreptococcaceae bacterium]|nr:hypothetical protein [Peptostreptococcaceae bacterium]
PPKSTKEEQKIWDKKIAYLEREYECFNLEIFINKLLLLANLIDKNPVCPEFEKTREFESLIRDQLSLSTITSTERIRGVNKYLEFKQLIEKNGMKDIFSIPICENLNREEIYDRNPFLRFAFTFLILWHSDGKTNRRSKVFNISDHNLDGLLNICKSLYSEIEEALNIRILIGETENLSIKVKKNCLAYVCFYALCTYLRRTEHLKELSELIEHYKTAFERKSHSDSNENMQEGFVSFEHIELESMNDVDIELETLDQANKLTDKMKSDNVGVVMLYGDLVAKYYENNPNNICSKCEKHLTRAIYFLTKPEDWLKEENRKLLTGYPKTHTILARVHSSKGDYEKAIECVEEGIRLQKQFRVNHDYVERLATFYDYLTMFKVKKNLEKVEEGLKKIETQERKNLETLAIFSTFISLVVGSFSIIARESTFSAHELIRVLLALFGLVIVTYSLFYGLSRSKELMRVKGCATIFKKLLMPMLTFLLGVIMVCCGLFVLAS